MEHLSKNVKQLFRFINEENQTYINDYYMSNLTRDYKTYTDNEQIYINNEYSNQDIELIKEYSGYNYKHINNALRNIWNYEENGNIERMNEFLMIGDKLAEIIRTNPTNLGNFKTYRGVNLSYFKEYGIEKIEDLNFLKGQFLLDKGFISTSLSEEKCFFKKENELGIDYNVKITYLITEEFDDGIFLTENMCYNAEQKEYLINNYNLARVVDVTINKDNTAHITAMMIPKMVYDEYYANLRDNKTR